METEEKRKIIEMLVEVGLCPPRNYKLTIWLHGKKVIDVACEYNLAESRDLGRGDCKYVSPLEPVQITQRLLEVDDVRIERYVIAHKRYEMKQAFLYQK